MVFKNYLKKLINCLYNGDMYEGEEGNEFELDVIGDYMLNPNNSSEYYQGYKLKKRN